MGRGAVEQLLYLMDGAFDGEDEEGLIGNLRSVAQADWGATPPGGTRSIRQIVGHIGACKYMYDNHAFGNAELTWDDPAADVGVSMEDLQSRILEREPPMDRVIDWLMEGQRRLREHLAAIEDSDLLAERRSPEGAMRETRWIAANMIRHDDFHAGEINHIRALLQGNDRWAWEEATS